jgi:Calponin homology (CH) domain
MNGNTTSAAATSSRRDNVNHASSQERQSPSVSTRRRQLWGRTPRIAPQSTTATRRIEPQQHQHEQHQHHHSNTKAHFGRQHHSTRPSAWTIPLVEDDEDEEELEGKKKTHHPFMTIATTTLTASASAISEDDHADDDADDVSDGSQPLQPYDNYEAPLLALVTPDRVKTLGKSHGGGTTSTTTTSTKEATSSKPTTNAATITIKRSLVNSHRKQKLHSITPILPTNNNESRSQAESHLRPEYPLAYPEEEFQPVIRGNGVVLDLTRLFFDPMMSSTPNKVGGPQSPTEETATTAASTQPLLAATGKSNMASTSTGTANNNVYHAPTPWKQHRATPLPGLVPPTTTSQEDSFHDKSFLDLLPNSSSNNTSMNVDLPTWDTKSQTTQEAMATERQSQALTHWLNFVLVGEQQHLQQQQEQDRSNRNKPRRYDGRSMDGTTMMSHNDGDDDDDDDGVTTVAAGTTKGLSVMTPPRSVTTTPGRAMTAAASVSSDRTTPIKNPSNNNDKDTQARVVVVKRRCQHHHRISLFQYAQSLEHAQETAHHWFHHSAQWKELRKRIRDEIASGKMQLREDRDLYANIGCREQLLDMFLSYRPEWLTMALEVVMNDSILQPHQQQGNQQLGQVVLPSNKQLKQFIVQRVLSDSKVLAKYNQGHGSGTPSGKFEVAYHEELRSLVLYRILVLIFFLDRAAVKFQALKNKSHNNSNNNLGNLFQPSSKEANNKLLVKSSQQMLVIFCREFLSRQGDVIKQLARVNLLVYYKQDLLDEIEYPIVNFAIDLRDGVRLCRVLELLWLLPRQKTFYAHNNDLNNNNSSNGGKNGIDLRAKYPLLSQLRIPAISRLQKIHNVNVALTALQDDCHIGLPQELQAHHIVDGQRRMVLRLIWTIVLMHCFDNNHSKVLTLEQLEAEIAQIQAARHHHSIMRERRRCTGEEIERMTSLTLLEQETNATESVAFVGVDDRSLLSSDGKRVTPKAQKSTKPPLPSLSISISRSSSFDGDQSFASHAQLEDMPLIRQWKGLLFHWCQQICTVVDDLERDDLLRTGGPTPIKKTSSVQWTASELTNGKALCCLIHHYHPSLLTLEELRLSSTIIDGPPTKIHTAKTPTSRFHINRQRQKSDKVAPDYYMRLAQRNLSEIGGIPPMMLLPLAPDGKGQRRKQPIVMSLADEKSILVFLYHVCARLMESRHQVNAVIFVQQRYRFIQWLELRRKKLRAARTIWTSWLANKRSYYRARVEKYRRAVSVLEVFTIQHFDKLLFLRKGRLERELQNVAATPIQVSRARTNRYGCCSSLY